MCIRNIVHTIEKKFKESNGYDGCIIGDSRQKGSGNNIVVSERTSGIQNFKENNNKRFNDSIG